MKEYWRDIPGYEGKYQVSDNGCIKSLTRQTYGGRTQNQIRKGRPRKTSCDKDGYLRVRLSSDGKYKMHNVHRIVATTFIPNPSNLPQVNHKDGIKTNNKVSNLEWCTGAENVRHAYKTGLASGAQRKGENNGFAKLTNLHVDVIRDAIQNGYKQRTIAAYFKVSEWTVSMIKTNKHRVNQ